MEKGSKNRGPLARLKFYICRANGWLRRKKVGKSVSLSVVIITFNEERNLERCLISVQDVADEILVVDSFSTDRTKEIALRHGARFLEHAFEGHIEQKNWAAAQATHPHILSLDADEALTEELKAAILQVKMNWEDPGYHMNRLTYYCGHWVRHCGWYPDRKLRLWDFRLGKWGGLNPHDKFMFDNPAQQSQALAGDLLHYSYYTREDHLKQLHYFSSIAAKAHVKAGKSSSLLMPYLSPVAKFVSVYLIRLGFLDGAAGWKIAWLSAYGAYLKYHQINQLLSQKPA